MILSTLSRLTSSRSAATVGRLASACLLLLTAAGSASAAELVVRDLQAVALLRPTPFDFKLETPTLTREGDDAFDGGAGLELGGRYSISRVGDPFGLVLGLDATVDSYSYDSDDFMLMYGARGSAGFGYAINDDWTLIAEAGVSYGRTNLSLPGGSATPGFDADGSYLGYDARIACYVGITRHARISLHAGYMVSSHDLTTDRDDTLTIDQRGPYAGIGLTWRFSSAPERVE